MRMQHRILALLIAVNVIDRMNAATIQAARCAIDTSYKNGDLPSPQPLLLSDASPPAFLRPQRYKTLELALNDSIILACPGWRNTFINDYSPVNTLRLRCLGGNRFMSDQGFVRPISEFGCTQQARETVKKSAEKCPAGGQKYLIGFAIDTEERRGAFLRLIEICRNETSLQTLYAKFRMPREIENRQTSVPRTSFKYGSFYPGFGVGDAYRGVTQLSSLTLLLGSEELASDYTGFGKPLADKSVVRGHLAAKADFLWAPEQLATFWYLNSAPQWNFFNGGNWLQLENSVRRFSSTRQLDLDVYTGVHGSASLVDVTGNTVPHYLFVNGTDQLLPVPRFFWKILSDPVAKRAVAFVGLNEPCGAKLAEDMFLCEDVGKYYGEKFNWLAWKPRNLTLGLSYVCRVGDLRKSVPQIPDFGDVELLY